VTRRNARRQAEPPLGGRRRKAIAESEETDG
jgi:hypothetical protein